MKMFLVYLVLVGFSAFAHGAKSPTTVLISQAKLQDSRDGFFVFIDTLKTPSGKAIGESHGVCHNLPGGKLVSCRIHHIYPEGELVLSSASAPVAGMTTAVIIGGTGKYQNVKGYVTSGPAGTGKFKYNYYF